MILKKMCGFRLHHRTIDILDHLETVNGLDKTKQIERLIEAEARILAQTDADLRAILERGAVDYAKEVRMGMWAPQEKSQGRSPMVRPGSRDNNNK